MKIDLREIPVYWINLDTATKNAERMTKMFEKLGFKNTIRKSARVIAAPPNTIPSNKHYVGCAQSHIDIFEIEDLKTPFLILEDDAEVTENFNCILDIPDKTDSVYLGVSTGNRGYSCARYNDQYKRIAGVLATHAILYTSERYRKAVTDMAKLFVYKRYTPFDVACAYLQNFNNVLTPNKVYFYQTNEAESANKWEHLTNCELEINS